MMQNKLPAVRKGSVSRSLAVPRSDVLLDVRASGGLLKQFPEKSEAWVPAVSWQTGTE